MLATMGELTRSPARGRPIEPSRLSLATLGGARALALDDRIGTLAPGREADMVVLDPARRRCCVSLQPVAFDHRDAGGADHTRRRPRRARDLCGRASLTAP